LQPGVLYDFTPVAPTARPFPAVMASVWEDVETGHLGLAMVNHTDQVFTGEDALSFNVDLTAYGLAEGSSVVAYEVNDQDQWSEVGTLPVQFPAGMALDAEEMRFFVLVPLD